MKSRFIEKLKSRILNNCTIRISFGDPQYNKIAEIIVYFNEDGSTAKGMKFSKRSDMIYIVDEYYEYNSRRKSYFKNFKP